MSAVTPTRPHPPSVPPEVEHLFQVSLLLLVVTGFGALAATGKLDPVSLVCVLAALLLRAVLLLRDRPFTLPRRVATWLAVLYPLIFCADFFFFSGRDFVAPAVHLVLFGICVKLFNVERERDYIYLALLAFLMVLSAAILTVDSAFLAAFALFLVLAVFWFMAMELRRSAMAAARTAPLALPRLRRHRLALSPLHRLAGSLAGTTALMTAGILAAATLIFFAIPRLGGGYVSRHTPSDVLSVGYSDSVDLGVIGRIEQSSEVVAHIHIDGDTTGGHLIRLRGAVLTHFDGKRWSNPPRASNVLSQSYGQLFQLTTRAAQLRRNDLRIAQGPQLDLLKYRVLMEPLSTNVIFTIPSAQALFGPFRQIGVDGDLTFHNLDPDHSVTLYEGVSDISAPLPTTLAKLPDGPEPGAKSGASAGDRVSHLRQRMANAASASDPGSSPGAYPPGFAERYLQLPEPLDPRIPQLARRITATEPNSYLRAQAIEHYLASRYAYTLQLPAHPAEDPVADFLFHRRRGHCEYFASAMAVQLRSVGIPSRIVNGFRGAQFNPLNDTYIVRASNAHSWVEAFIPGAGWVTFDPTPAGNSTVSATLWSRWQLYLDAGREFWQEWIVNYDAGHQQALSVAATRQGRNRIAELRRWLARGYGRLLELARRFHRAATESPQRLLRHMSAWLALLLAIGLALGALHLHERWRAASPRLSPRSAASILYLRMSRRLARRGYSRPLAQTPAEFAASIAEAPLRQAVARFTASYERARFGGSPEEAAQLPALLDEIRSALSRR
jgi:protein-glutamine gamma-glutamyltransferase